MRRETIIPITFDPPEPNTDAMVTLLHQILDGAAESFSNLTSFTRGDLMGAALYMVVEVGSEGSPPDKLREDIIAAVDRILADMAQEKARMN